MTAGYTDFVGYYNAYKHKVYSFLLYRVHGDKQLAEDLTSDVFLKAYEKFASYNDDFAFSTWIYTIARNVCIDYIRSHKELKALEEAQDVADEDTLSDASRTVNTRMSMDQISSSLQALPALQRECIILKHLEEMTTKQIALSLGESEANVRQAMSRGLKKLQSLSVVVSLLFFSVWQFNISISQFLSISTKYSFLTTNVAQIFQ